MLTGSDTLSTGPQHLPGFRAELEQEIEVTTGHLHSQRGGTIRELNLTLKAAAPPPATWSVGLPSALPHIPKFNVWRFPQPCGRVSPIETSAGTTGEHLWGRLRKDAQSLSLGTRRTDTEPLRFLSPPEPCRLPGKRRERGRGRSFQVPRRLHNS